MFKNNEFSDDLDELLLSDWADRVGFDCSPIDPHKCGQRAGMQTAKNGTNHFSRLKARDPQALRELIVASHKAKALKKKMRLQAESPSVKCRTEHPTSASVQDAHPGSKTVARRSAGSLP